MKTTGEILDLSIDFETKKIKTTFLIDTKDVNVLENLSKMKKKKLDIDIKKYIERRSGKSNRYFWDLLCEVCEKMNLNPVEEYRRRIKDLGIFRHWDIEKENLETFKKMWQDKGIAWFIDIVDIEANGRIPINAYYGSSSFNKKQMHRLIDNLVQDCQAIGIETKSPKEIESMLKEYDAK